MDDHLRWRRSQLHRRPLHRSRFLRVHLDGHQRQRRRILWRVSARVSFPNYEILTSLRNLWNCPLMTSRNALNGEDQITNLRQRHKTPTIRKHFMLVVKKCMTSLMGNHFEVQKDCSKTIPDTLVWIKNVVCWKLRLKHRSTSFLFVNFQVRGFRSSVERWHDRSTGNGLQLLVGLHLLPGSLLGNSSRRNAHG